MNNAIVYCDNPIKTMLSEWMDKYINRISVGNKKIYKKQHPYCNHIQNKVLGILPRGGFTDECVCDILKAELTLAQKIAT